MIIRMLCIVVSIMLTGKLGHLDNFTSLDSCDNHLLVIP